MSYIPSANIKVYPTAHRGYDSNKLYNPDSRLATEFNITNSINQISDSKGYIISPAYGTTLTANTVFEINIMGYYFKFTPGFTSGNLWAKISIGSRGGNVSGTDYQDISLLSSSGYDVDLDSSSQFIGLELVTSAPSNNVYSLQLLENGNLCKASYRKIKASSIYNDSESQTIEQKFTTTNLNATTATLTNINGCQLTEETTGFKLKGGSTTEKTLTISADTSISGAITITHPLTVGANTSISGTTSITHPLTVGATTNISAALNIGSNSDTTISAPVTINRNLTVGSAEKTGTVGIFSNGSSNTNIYGPNGKACTLPANTENVGSYVFAQTKDSSDNLTSSMVSYATSDAANSIVYRDENKNFSAGTITATLNGNASTATKLANSVSLWGQSFDGSGNVSGALTGVTNITASGTITAATFNATSDKRLKENIVEFKPKKSILDLPVYEFDYIDSKIHTIGCMAQDLQEICPQIVSEIRDGYLAINENKLVYLLLEEVKELKKEVESLKKGE